MSDFVKDIYGNDIAVIKTEKGLNIYQDYTESSEYSALISLSDAEALHLAQLLMKSVYGGENVGS